MKNSFQLLGMAAAAIGALAACNQKPAQDVAPNIDKRPAQVSLTREANISAPKSMDVEGVYLGQPLDEAYAVVAALPEGAEMAKPGRLEITIDRILTPATGRPGFTEREDNWSGSRWTVFARGPQGRERVVAIFRETFYPASKRPPITESLEKLATKFGPANAIKGGGDSLTLLWGTSGSGGAYPDADRMSLDCAYTNSHTSMSVHVGRDCGRMVTARIGSDENDRAKTYMLAIDAFDFRLFDKMVRAERGAQQ